jgi:hypothetical protein
MEVWSVLAPEWRAARARACNTSISGRLRPPGRAENRPAREDLGILKKFSDSVRTVRSMGTKTEDEAGAKTGTEAQRDEEAVELTKGDDTKIGEVEEAEAAEAADDQADSEDLGEDEYEDDEVAKLAAERRFRRGPGCRRRRLRRTRLRLADRQLGRHRRAGARDARSASWRPRRPPAWPSRSSRSTATPGTPTRCRRDLRAGALIVGVVVLVRPAFGNPDRIPAQAPWVKSVAWAGVALGVVGLLLAVLKYSDILLSHADPELRNRTSEGP